MSAYKFVLNQRLVPYIHRSFIHDSCQAGLNSTLLTVPALHPLIVRPLV